MRINKFLSQCGVTSRRGAEKLIAEGRVSINDVVVDNFGSMVDLDKDAVTVDDQKIALSKDKYYVILNKPRYVLTTMTDPFGRKTVASLVKKVPGRIYPVGRLDFDTEGVLLLTNDGELAYRLAHPKFGVKRIYHAIVKGAFTSENSRQLEVGIELEDGHIGQGSARIQSAGMESSKVEVVLYEGHKREVKQLLKAVGHPVIKLKRVEFAGLRLGKLRWGQWRHLTNIEVEQLKESVQLTVE